MDAAIALHLAIAPQIGEGAFEARNQAAHRVGVVDGFVNFDFAQANGAVAAPVGAKHQTHEARRNRQNGELLWFGRTLQSELRDGLVRPFGGFGRDLHFDILGPAFGREIDGGIEHDFADFARLIARESERHGVHVERIEAVGGPAFGAGVALEIEDFTVDEIGGGEGFVVVDGRGGRQNATAILRGGDVGGVGRKGAILGAGGRRQQRGDGGQSDQG